MSSPSPIQGLSASARDPSSNNILGQSRRVSLMNSLALGAGGGTNRSLTPPSGLQQQQQSP